MKRIMVVLSAVVLSFMIALPVEAQQAPVGSASGNGIQTWLNPGTQVVITDSGVSPNPITIPIGGVVTFVNLGSTVHTAVTLDGANPTFDTGGLSPGQSANFQFTMTGSFPYQSNTEGDRFYTNNNGMVTTTYKLSGTIIVQSGPVAPASPAPAAAPAPGPCQFVLGFATVARSVPQVGQCLDSQAFAPNGDAVQHTAGGLLVWRKSDNWTAFTDGYRTWVNGPFGIQQRLNTARLSWER